MPVASQDIKGDLPSVTSLKLDSKKRRPDGEVKQVNVPVKKKKLTAEGELRFSLETCSKAGDIVGALDIYDRTKKQGLKLNQYHYNILLYLCSSAALGARCGRVNEASEADVEDDGILFRGKMAALVPSRETSLSAEVMAMAQRRGFEIREDMKLEQVPVNEATFTSLARLAVAKRDGDLAFAIVKDMTEAGVAPKLRSYGPALYTYFKTNEVDKAFEVDEHMRSFGVQPEEMELQILLELSSRAGLEKRAYSVLHRLRRVVREVSSSTASSIQKWFLSDAATQAGSAINFEDVRKSLVSLGGGGHELGWLGRGIWTVNTTVVDENGVCQNCKQKMAKVDVNVQETEEFAKKLAALACEKERNSSSFTAFQAWLEEHGPFDAIVDGANVALFNQNFNEGAFSFAQLNSVVSHFQKEHGKLPLIILYNRRVNAGPAQSPEAQQMLQLWREANALYTTPNGSNDDWYWLYASVKCCGLLISNDEMRDHIFQLLGNDFFPKWKERHQVRFSFSKNGTTPVLELPPPYSVVLQESVTGSWHVPFTGKDGEHPWLCVTRPDFINF